MSVMGKALSFLQGSGNNGGEFMKKTGDTYIYLSEFLGTFIFLLCGIGCVGALKLAGAGFGQWEISIVWGLAVAMGVYVCGGVCGAHLNPSVTIALALFGDFDRRKVVPYILVQMLAGFCAAALAYAMYYNLFADAVAATIDELQGFFVSMGMPRTLGELGVTAEQIPALLVTLEQNKGRELGDLMRLTLDDARAIYESAL